MKILIVDDEEPIRHLIRFNLEKSQTTSGDNFSCAESGTCTDALEKARCGNIDLILLDLMLPDMSGLDLCRILKNDARTKNIPIIMLTAKTAESDIVEGLNLGADDYITKPFSPRVLVARINSVLRRIANVSERGVTGDVISIGDLKIIESRREVFLGDEKIDLTATEFSLLELLSKNAGRVFSRQQIISALRGGEYCVTERAVDVQILSLRKKLGDNGKFIETLRGVGYRFKYFIQEEK